MIELLMILSLTPAATNPTLTAQFKPCVWPNTCATEQVKTPDVEICLAPRKCAKAAEKVEVAQFQPCVWPNKCAKAAPVAPVVAQFKPCVWPNTCSKAVPENILL